MISGLPVGTVLSDGTNRFTATSTATSVNVAGWALTNLKVTPANDADFTLTAMATVQDAQGNTSTASASETVTVAPLAPTVTWSSASATGVEGSPIALATLAATVNSLTGDTNTLGSLVISGLPVGTVLSDGTNRFTATSTATSVNVAGWALANLKVTPANDADFTLTATATVQDAQGNTSTASASETVTVAPLAPTVTWSSASASGAVGSAIALGTITDQVNGLSGDTNTLQSLVVSGVPVGAVLSDGTNSFTATASGGSVNVAGWNLAALKITVASAALFTLTATATVQDAQGATGQATASETVSVTASSSTTTQYADGSASASSGTPELPNLFSGYSVRPPWEVAGVDYHVGVPSNQTLLQPTAANLPAGTTLDGQLILVTANNVTINGFDFSGNGGYGIYIEAGVTGTRITNNLFVDRLVHRAAGRFDGKYSVGHLYRLQYD